MINLHQLDYSDKIVTLDISGLATELDYRTCQIHNGTNSLNKHDMCGVISALINIDDLTISNSTSSYTFFKADYSYTLNNNELKEFKVLPFAHQIEAINYGLSHDKILLLDSMGLG